MISPVEQVKKSSIPQELIWITKTDISIFVLLIMACAN